MPKEIDDLRQYWQEIATKAGLPEDKVSAISGVLGDESVARAFRQGFVPVPEHHSTLDQMKNRVTSREQELNDWYQRVAVPAYQSNLSGIEKLRQYESLYGEIDGSATNNPGAETMNLTPEEIDRRLEEKLRARDQAFVGLVKAIPRMSFDYYKRFGEVLDSDAVEKIALENGLPPDLAYERYIAPKVEAQRSVELEAKIKAAREEGYRDALSKSHLPVDSTPRDSNPFFEREEPKPGTSDLEQDRGSRQAFLEGWNNYADELAKQHRS